MTGLVIGLVGCITGLGIVIHTNNECKKDKKEIEDIMKQVDECNEDLNNLLEQLKMK
jgi:hypothetical protein